MAKGTGNAFDWDKYKLMDKQVKRTANLKKEKPEMELVEKMKNGNTADAAKLAAQMSKKVPNNNMTNERSEMKRSKFTQFMATQNGAECTPAPSTATS